MDTPFKLPILHRLFAGELKHHYLQKDGRLAYQKAPLTVHSNRQRIGYQMLTDESRGVFIDLYPVDDSREPRLELVYSFLALAWSVPLSFESEPMEPLGIPQVLSVPRKLVTDEEWEELGLLGQRLDFKLVSPTSGFDAGVHLVKELGKGLDSVSWLDGAENVNWLVGRNMERLSTLVSGYATIPIRCNRPMREFQAGSFGREVVYERRPVPADWLQRTASMYGNDSVEEFLMLCGEYFFKDEK